MIATNVNKVAEAFEKTIKMYGLKINTVAQLAGTSRQHLSDFRRGKGSITIDMLCNLIDALEKTDPSARLYFCSLLAGREIPPRRQISEVDYLIERIEEVPIKDLPEIIGCIIRRMNETVGEIRVVFSPPKSGNNDISTNKSGDDDFLIDDTTGNKDD